MARRIADEVWYFHKGKLLENVKESVPEAAEDGGKQGRTDHGDVVHDTRAGEVSHIKDVGEHIEQERQEDEYERAFEHAARVGVVFAFNRGEDIQDCKEAEEEVNYIRCKYVVNKLLCS